MMRMIRALGVLLLLAQAKVAGDALPQTGDAAAKEFEGLLNAGKTVEAEAVARRLLVQEAAANRGQSPETQRGLDLLLEIYAYRTDRSTNEIDEVGRQATALRERLQGPESLATAQTLRLWAIAQLGLGNYPGARTMVDRAVKIFETAEQAGTQFSRVDLAQYSRAVFAMAGILTFMRDWHGAKRVLLKSIALKERLSTTSPGIGVSYMNLGRLEHYLGNHGEAVANYHKADGILKGAVGPGDPLFPDLKGSEGYCLYEMGSKSEGLAMVEQALKAREAIHSPTDTEIVGTLRNLADLYRMEKRFTEAQRLAERAVAIDRKAYGPLHPEVAEKEALLARVLAEAGETKASLELALDAERIARDHLTLSVATLPEREATLFTLKRVSALNIAVSAAVDAQGDTVAPVFDAVVRSRAIVFDELASRHRVMGSASEDSELVAKLSEDLRAARERLARLAMSSRDRSEQRLQEALEGRDAVERKLAAASVQYRRRAAGKSAGLKEVAAALPEDTVLVSFVRFGHVSPGSIEDTDEYAAFLLTKGVPALVSLGAALEIESAVDGVRSKLAAEAAAPGMAMKRNEAAYRVSAEKLRKLIWDPIDRHVTGAKRIFIVPDGALHMINFAALPEAGTDSRYLVERGMLFHYLSAERDLVTEASLDPAGVGLLAVGNPSFNRPELARGKAPGRKTDTLAGNNRPVFRGARSSCSAMQTMQFAELPSSAKEVENISRLWKRDVIGSGDVIELTGELAGPERFKAMAPGRRTIHLAVHGFVAGMDCADPLRNENPLLLTGLALAGANWRGGNQTGEDGILTAEEIASLDLRGVEWAVLSACDTGLGKATRSEGVFGLRRAFQMAGAHTVIMSLWPVEDKVTTDWMQVLYEKRLSRQMDTANSVRAASVEMLKRRRAAGTGTHPFYWAPFVAVGDWR